MEAEWSPGSGSRPRIRPVPSPLRLWQSTRLQKHEEQPVFLLPHLPAFSQMMMLRQDLASDLIAPSACDPVARQYLRSIPHGIRTALCADGSPPPPDADSSTAATRRVGVYSKRLRVYVSTHRQPTTHLTLRPCPRGLLFRGLPPSSNAICLSHWPTKSTEAFHGAHLPTGHRISCAVPQIQSIDCIGCCTKYVSVSSLRSRKGRSKLAETRNASPTNHHKVACAPARLLRDRYRQTRALGHTMAQYAQDSR